MIEARMAPEEPRKQDIQKGDTKEDAVFEDANDEISDEEDIPLMTENASYLLVDLVSWQLFVNVSGVFEHWRNGLPLRWLSPNAQLLIKA